MTRTRILVATAVVMLLALATVAGMALYRRAVGLDRRDRQTPEQLRQQIINLDTERTALRARLDALVERDPGPEGMPETPVRVAVPTSLARDLMQRVLIGLTDRLTLTFRNITVRRTGTVKRVVTLGDYDLRVTVTRVRATLKAGAPTLTFGSNRVALAMPVTLGGTGRADVDFTWDGRTVGGAVCGDMHITESVTGAVVPRTYPVSGAVQLEATATEIVARPRLPRLKLHVDVTPSDASWAAVQQILDDKRGLCGFVLDRVDVMGVVKRLIDKGFDVRIPTERVGPVALPVGIEPTLLVRGTPVALGIRVGGLAITEQAIWLGAHVSLARGQVAAPPSPPAGVTPGGPAR